MDCIVNPDHDNLASDGDTSFGPISDGVLHAVHESNGTSVRFRDTNYSLPVV